MATITVSVDGSLERLIAAHGVRILDAANEAVVTTTEQVKLLQRQAVAQGLKGRAFQLIGANTYLDVRDGLGVVTGFTHSRWFRAPRGGKTVSGGAAARLNANDIMQKHVVGGGIFPQKPGKKFLYIPLGGAGRFARRARLNFRDKNVSLIPLARRRGFLVIDFGRSGKRKGGRGQPVAMLLDRVYLRRRVTFTSVESRGAKLLNDRFTIAMAKRAA